MSGSLLYFYLKSKDSYPTLFGITAVSVVGAIFINHILFQYPMDIPNASSLNVFMRDTIFVVCFISLSAFVTGRRFAAILTSLHLILVFFYAFYANEKFVQVNIGLFVLSLIGYGLIVHFLVNSVNNFMKSLSIANETITRQSEVLDLKNKELTSSITYAEKLQQSTLPSIKLSSVFNRSFLIYKPKDIVSGDFYWLEEDDQFKYFAVSDCTGHGIPGAFISLIGTILLNEIYNSKKMKDPSMILTELNRLIKLTLENEKVELYDGMDIAFCALDKKKNVLHFSGAINSVWIVSSDSTKKMIHGKTLNPLLEEPNGNLFEIKGDDFPIGNYIQSKSKFRLIQMQLKEGDQVYLSTDGYADQFGGPNNKKMQKKRLKRILLQNSKMSLEDQKSRLIDFYDQWKGRQEQVDDICIVGVEI
jgi:serine phosphatase RsbU (regulator of sigma subunit)